MAVSENRCKIANILRGSFFERGVLLQTSFKAVVKCLKPIAGRVLFYVILPAISLRK